MKKKWLYVIFFLVCLFVCLFSGFISLYRRDSILQYCSPDKVQGQIWETHVAEPKRSIAHRYCSNQIIDVKCGFELNTQAENEVDGLKWPISQREFYDRICQMLAAAVRLFDDRRSKWNIGFFFRSELWYLWYFADYLPTTSDFIFYIVCRFNLPHITTAVIFKLTGTRKLELIFQTKNQWLPCWRTPWHSISLAISLQYNNVTELFSLSVLWLHFIAQKRPNIPILQLSQSSRPKLSNTRRGTSRLNRPQLLFQSNYWRQMRFWT